MDKTVAEQLDAAAKRIGEASADRSQQRVTEVDKGLFGDNNEQQRAPSVLRSLAYHIPASASLFGKKSVFEVFGVGEVPTNGRPGPDVHVSVNLRDAKSFRAVSPEMKEMLLDLKKQIHNAQIQQQMLVAKRKMPVAVDETPYFKAVVAPLLKAFSLADFSAWVPTLNLGFYFEELDLDPVVDKYFPRVTMTSKTVTVPGSYARLKGRLQSDVATFSAQYNTQDSYQMIAQDCVASTDISEDLMQDMVPQSGGFDRLRKEVAMGVMRSKEDAIINGDDTTSSVQGDNHMDSDIASDAATNFNKAFKGLRKRALAASRLYDNAGAGLSLGTFNGTLRELGKFAKEKGDLLFILGPSLANNEITGAVPEILTHDKFGPANATISSGVLPRVFGVEQYESEWVREDVNSSGVYASSQELTTMLLLKKSRFAVGERAPMKMWATPTLADADKMIITAKERFSFGGIPQSSREKSVAIAINIALT